MIKQFIILLLFSIQLSAQNKDANPHFPKIKITFPCNQEYLNNYKGRWLIPDKLVSGPNKNYLLETIKRVSQVHNLVEKIYPEPMGSDAYWRCSNSKNDFAYTIRYFTKDGETQKKYLQRNQVEGWTYYMTIFAWFCNENGNEIWNGYPDAGGGNAITVYANSLPVLAGEFMNDDVWTIDGRPIKTKMPVIGTWKGYDVMATNGGIYADQNSDWFILVTRNNMLPYIPITRKQYLDRAIAYNIKFYDNLIAINEQIKDQTEKNENKKRYLNGKDLAVRNLQNELQKTTKDGLLSAPAVVRPDAHFQTDGPIFLSEKDGGVMLTTENPDYFRKDLSGYVPQFFVLSWSWAGKQKWETDFRKAIEENFPVEKLQAMIDK